MLLKYMNLLIGTSYLPRTNLATYNLLIHVSNVKKFKFI
jgi:hypothetical protein